jgi:tetratricopeptide (TPR) repeat protein
VVAAAGSQCGGAGGGAAGGWAEARPDAFLPDLATSLNNQSLWLAALGREEALAAIEQAVTIRRQLAQARPDAFLPDLATSLRVLAYVLNALGRESKAMNAQAEADAIGR